MAPELTAGLQQSHKVDVFSLGVSILYLANAGRLAEIDASDPQHIELGLHRAFQDTRFSMLQYMLYLDPLKRASAQQYFLDNLDANDSDALNMVPKAVEDAVNNDHPMI